MVVGGVMVGGGWSVFCSTVCPGAELNRIKRNYLESQSRRTSKLRGLSDELQGVQKIMFENIDAALQRGELVSGQCSLSRPSFSFPSLLLSNLPLNLPLILRSPSHPPSLRNKHRMTVGITCNTKPSVPALYAKMMP